MNTCTVHRVISENCYKRFWNMAVNINSSEVKTEFIVLKTILSCEADNVRYIKIWSATGIKQTSIVLMYGNMTHIKHF